ncbi:superoxide dismutase [Nonomuraea phyllanthi]|uniref:Superoxide dismutase n=1 Tax=Nonomuraea phyllanthi TaxID=2219224 RepID=A0A5C4WE64_9ACTN|nr:superoxide dismutase [Nonomuraea phyllanthi]KAB8193177.1 superoxide dismutase [Nonomuraea phyllanthi]QFY10961.1 superoxide dismutase [Nonomuraea phyllanthi]
MRSAILKTALSTLAAALLIGAPAQAAGEPAAQAAGKPATQAGGKPDAFALPNGFQPEGIEIGPGPYAYLGSRATGDIYRADLRTGKGSVISKGPGTPSLGLKTDRRGRLFVAGGTGGDARVIDLRTGRVLKSYRLATGTSFVNDVVLTRHAAYFTDSANPVLYKLTLGRGGALPDEAVTIPLSGDIQYTTGTNANGIVPSPDRRSLLIVQSNTGKLFEADPSTGVTTEVDLGGESLVNGDGLLLSGRTLYAVQNRLNAIAVVGLARDGSSGKVVERLTDPRFDVPSTVAAHGRRLYLPNARFTTPPTPDTPYSVVAVKR